MPGCPATVSPRKLEVSPKAGGLPVALTSALMTVAVTVLLSRFRPWTSELTRADGVLSVARPVTESVTVPLVRMPGIDTDAPEFVLVLPAVPKQASDCGN